MNDEAKKLSVLIAGCGSIGKRHARILSDLGVEDIRVCDPSVEQLESLRQETPIVRPCDSYEVGLEAKPDCVWIMTPPHLHIPMATRALTAKCHVFCEKPLSESAARADELQRVVEGSGCKFMVGLCFRYHTGLLEAKAMLDAGRVGRLVSVRALMGEHIPDFRPDYKQVWCPAAISGGAFDLMHDIDLAIWYAGQDVARVESVFGQYSDIGMEAPDVVEVLMGFEDRCCASVHLDFFQRPRRRQIELIGTEGVITVEFASWDECTVSIWSNAVGAWEHTTTPTNRDDMFRDEDSAFLEAVVTDAPIHCTIAEAVKSVAVVEACLATR
jgi:predicted dehydrogenase